MPDIAPCHPWFVFAHVLGIFGFLIFHGVSVGVLFRIRNERDPHALRALLDLSRRSFGGMGIGFLVFFAGSNYTRLQFNTGVRYMAAASSRRFLRSNRMPIV